MATRRRSVRLVIGANKLPMSKSRLWAYDKKALADVGGCSIAQVGSQIKSGALNPGDLWSVVAWAQQRMRLSHAKRLAKQSRLPR